MSMQCLAVSKASDPTGAYWYYALEHALYPSVGRLSIWPDAYYISYVLRTPGAISNVGPQVCGYNRTAMLRGGDANKRCKDLFSFYIVFVSDLESTTLPVLGETSPAFVMEVSAFSLTTMRYWRFSYTTNTISSPFSLSIAPYSVPGNIPQPGTTDTLNPSGDRLMHRLVYRNFGTYESVLALHNIQAPSGIYTW